MSDALAAENLSFTYEKTNPVLANISLQIEAGEKVGLVGSNGAGKSTLLWCLLGLLHHQGEVRLFGEKRDSKLLRQIGVVFQNPEDHLFMPSVLDDLMLPLLNQGVSRELAKQQANKALATVGLAAQGNRSARVLSLGQRKRAAIAAALVHSPDLLILDEPTAELDGRSRKDLASLLLSLPATMLIASHDLVFLDGLVDRVLALDSGRLAGSYPANAFFQNTDLQEKLCLI
jgi:cobalt/nickel transport system ATP-binding protein